jgi:hypothetical protein
MIRDMWISFAFALAGLYFHFHLWEVKVHVSTEERPVPTCSLP